MYSVAMNAPLVAVNASFGKSNALSGDMPESLVAISVSLVASPERFVAGSARYSHYNSNKRFVWVDKNFYLPKEKVYYEVISKEQQRILLAQGWKLEVNSEDKRPYIDIIIVVLSLVTWLIFFAWVITGENWPDLMKEQIDFIMLYIILGIFIFLTSGFILSLFFPASFAKEVDIFSLFIAVFVVAAYTLYSNSKYNGSNRYKNNKRKKIKRINRKK